MSDRHVENTLSSTVLFSASRNFCGYRTVKKKFKLMNDVARNVSSACKFFEGDQMISVLFSLILSNPIIHVLDIYGH
jgi:hypothetical protein